MAAKRRKKLKIEGGKFCVFCASSRLFLKAVGFVEVDDGDFAVVEDLVGVLQSGVEFERLAGLKEVLLAGEVDLQLAGLEPADFKVVAVGLGLGKLCAGLGGGVVALDTLEVDAVEVEGAGNVALLILLRGGAGFGEVEQVCRGEAKHPREAVQGVQLDHVLVTL